MDINFYWPTLYFRVGGISVDYLLLIINYLELWLILDVFVGISEISYSYNIIPKPDLP